MGFRWGLETYNSSLDEKVEKTERVFEDDYKPRYTRERNSYDELFERQRRSEQNRLEISRQKEKVRLFFKESEDSLKSLLKMEPTDDDDKKIIADAIKKSVEIYQKKVDEYRNIIYSSDISIYGGYSGVCTTLNALADEKSKCDKLIDELKEQYLNISNKNIEESDLSEEAYNYGSELNEKYSVYDKENGLSMEPWPQLGGFGGSIRNDLEEIFGKI